MENLIENLIKIGFLFETARQGNQPLPKETRDLAARVLQEAKEIGVSRNMVNTLLLEGETKAKLL